MQVPALAYNVAYAVNSSYVQTAPAYIVLSHMRNLLVNVNSAVNFILYCAVGHKFRRVFLQTFCQSACCGHVTAATTLTGAAVAGDLPSTAAASERNRRRTTARSTHRSWAGDASLPMQAIDGSDRSRTPSYQPCDMNNPLVD